MATCTKQTKQVPVTTTKEEKTIVLELSEEEANYIRILMSCTSSSAESRGIWMNISNSFSSVGINWDSAMMFLM